MTARELIDALAKFDPDLPIEVYRERDDDTVPTAVVPITGVDPYESAAVLVADWEWDGS